MAVNITFQSRDWHPRNPGPPNEVHIVAAGYDDDHGVLTVYSDEATGDNRTLAERAPYQNENGDECGEIAWRIFPEADLLREFPELARVVGWVYGRVIVTKLDGNMAVDKNRNDYVLLRDNHDDPVARALEVGTVKHASFHTSREGRWTGTVYDESTGIEYDVRQLETGWWNVNDDEGRDYAHADLKAAVLRANEANTVRNEVFTIIVRAGTGRDITPELASHNSIDGAKADGHPMGSFEKLDADNAVVVVMQIIDQGHEWRTDSESEVQPLRDRMAKFIREDGGSLGECVTPDGWQIFVFRFIEEG